MSRWHLITFFGESTFLLPCAIFLYAWLRWRGATRMAWHWLLAFSLTAALVLASKVAFMGWGVGSEAMDFTGFSGHSMMAASILPVLLYLAMPVSRPGLSLVAAAAGVVLALAVGVSRLALHAHSPSEVISGLALGFCVSLPFIMRHGVPHGPMTMTLACVVLVSMPLLPVSHMTGTTHGLVTDLALFLSGRDRPFNRGEWSALPPCTTCRTGAAGDTAGDRHRDEMNRHVDDRGGAAPHARCATARCPA
ncbi:phosphatase PAP2 family protein [Cupriavidus sp. SW-Y-13]|uniref:phosphatase PAP2 family protein n=1 Tax=Cupriavidus sp. SW-Y-13 TaxID=2653854 RepID=UPI0013657C65|nr:phosphatase PAP2 family protein [Cupriavidus sp. SW-Y-13]MWL90792.1 phosphatase PAP2 family protein [Cupriavidus sp. SW-Y-13]